MEKQVKPNKTLTMVQLSFLIALEIILTISPLGYIQLGFMTITLMHIPVLVGATVMGPFAGGLLGLVFGISSMIKSTYFGTPDAVIFSPFLTKSFKSVVLAVVPRVLFGIAAGFLFKILVKKGISYSVSTAISVGIGTLLHTIMVLGLIQLLFAKQYAELIGVEVNALFKIFLSILSINGLVEALVAVLVCFKLVPVLIKSKKG